ncbi:MAG: M48 family metalloprotease [Gammaproteobacteria bacterium]|nr:M48 family metalloprotease [Gammaproteobacteria bacterium]MBU1623410.1 M48 family metalloprotease [Gammaproteobacteria bacterium]MBU1982249.1 M48 family metalloprotease [Gammaproteobacteria bacterium]
MKTFLSALLLLTTFNLHAEGLPDLGDESQTVISPQMERQIGEQSMFQIRASEQYLNDPEVTDYLNRLGKRLVANSSEPSQPFEFFVIDDSAINAFAMPGGFIGVNTGLIMLSQSESELASVLSHEISHVTQHHLARMISGQKYDSLAAMATIAVAILAARDNPQAAQAGIVGAQGGLMQRQLDFTREHEKEADRIGLDLLQKSGFDSHAMPSFFERLQKATQLLEGDTPSYLRTHPLTTERVADVGNRVQHIPFKLVADSLDFHLVRARLNAMQKPPREAVNYFQSALGEQRFGNQVAQRYGLVLSLLRDRQDKRAAQEFVVLHKQAPRNATIETLAGRIRQLDKSDKGILDFYRTTLKEYPTHRALIYDYALLLLRMQHYSEALTLLDEQVNRDGNDAALYELQARAYTALGRHQEAHHVLSYYQILHGNLRGAIEQLELAKLAGNDYYQLSTIETELRQYREILESFRKKK